MKTRAIALLCIPQRICLPVRDLQEAADYHLTPCGQHANAPNKMPLTSLSSMISFTGFDRVELLTQPLMIVAGSQADSLWHSKELHAKAAGPKQRAIIDGATHMDLYDGARVSDVMGKRTPFFKTNLWNLATERRKP